MKLAFGILQITKADFFDMYPFEVNLAYEGYRIRVDEQKELIRWQCYYQLAPNQKEGFNISKVWLPGDKANSLEGLPVAKVRRLTREQIREEYRKAGFNVSEKRLDAHMTKRKRTNGKQK